MKSLFIIFLSLTLSNLVHADEVYLSEFVNGLNNGRSFVANEAVEIIREYDNEYECQEMVSGAIWSNKNKQCEFIVSQSAEVSMREDGMFDLFLESASGCSIFLTLNFESKNKDNQGRDVLVDDASSLLKVTIISKKQIRIEDSGLGLLQCGSAENFTGNYRKN